MNSVALANYSLMPGPPPPPPPSNPMVRVMAPPPPPPPPPRMPNIPPPPPNLQKFYCTLCRVACPNEFSFEQHINSARHQGNQANFVVGKNDTNSGLEPPPPSRFIHCNICNVTCPNKSSYKDHLKGAKHRKMVAVSGGHDVHNGKMEQTRENTVTTVVGESSTNISQRSGIVHCNICNISCPNNLSYEQHLQGMKHRKKAAAANGEVVLHAMNDANPKPISRDTAAAEDVNNMYDNALQSLLNAGKSSTANDPRIADRNLLATAVVPPTKVSMQLLETNVEEDSDEEGEIDEVKEDINKLYDDVEAPSSTLISNTQNYSIGEETKDRDIGEAIIDPDGVDGNMKKERDGINPDVDDMFGNKNRVSVPKTEHVVGMRGEHTFNEKIDDKMMPSSTVIAADGASHVKSFDGNVADTEHCDDNDVMEMFGVDDEPVCEHDSNGDFDKANWESTQDVDSSRYDNTRVWERDIEVDELGSTVEVLDCGLTFVLDYSPDTSTNCQVGGLRKREPIHNLAQAGSSPSDKVEISIGGNQKDKRNDASAQTRNLIVVTGDNTLDSAQCLATMLTNQMPDKRQPTKLPDRIPRFDVSPKQAYYPQVHPDKYWSELRNWDFVKDLNDAMKSEGSPSMKNEKGTKRSLEFDARKGPYEGGKNEGNSLPDTFQSVEQYKALWAPLLIKEAKAQLLSEVVAAQASPSTSWVQGTSVVMGAIAKLELARDSSLHDSSANASDPTVLLRIQSSTGSGCQVCANDLLLFVHQSSTIERALRGKIFEALSNSTLGKLEKGRLGFVGHVLNQRKLIRASKKYWSQFAHISEVFMVRIGSNVTGKMKYIDLPTFFCFLLS